jgi:hypothetical protein|tara:strand:- start:2171 stop:2320 length:150 start_codon:yes stop_codon:yes gene_type:complete
MHYNQVKTDRAYRERQKQAGVVPVRVMCPVSKTDELKELVAKWRRDEKA